MKDEVSRFARSCSPSAFILVLTPFRFAKCRHRRQAFGPGASQQLQQKRLYLVIKMVTQSDEIGLDSTVGLISQIAGRCLHAAAVTRHLHPPHCQRHAARLAQRLAESLPFQRMRADLVIDVDRRQRQPQVVAQTPQHVEQHHGVNAAAQSHGDAPAAHRVRFQYGCNSFQEPFGHGRVN